MIVVRAVIGLIMLGVACAFNHYEFHWTAVATGFAAGQVFGRS